MSDRLAPLAHAVSDQALRKAVADGAAAAVAGSAAAANWMDLLSSGYTWVMGALAFVIAAGRAYQTVREIMDGRKAKS